MQDYIYLILSSSSSLPAKIIKTFIESPLNHSSISLDDSLCEMYSFGRLKMWNAFYGGFVREHKDKGFYEKFTDTYVRVYRFPVSREVYQNTEKFLRDCYNRKEEFKYNLIGVAMAKINVPVVRKDQYFCSEFVAICFDSCKIRELNRNPHTYQPSFFEELPDKELIYDGMLRDYDREKLYYNRKSEEKEPVSAV